MMGFPDRLRSGGSPTALLTAADGASETSRASMCFSDAQQLELGRCAGHRADRCRHRSEPPGLQVRLAPRCP